MHISDFQVVQFGACEVGLFWLCMISEGPWSRGNDTRSMALVAFRAQTLH